MRTATIRLRPIMEADYPQMYASALDPRWSFRWRYRGATPSMQEFVAQVSQGILSQFMVERLSDRRAIGLVSCYNARTDLGWAYLAFTRVSTPTAAGGAEMMEGGFLFITFLFRNWSFRKLYAEVPGWNWDQFASGAGAFFTVEGVLTDHEYFDGRFWDQRIVALDRGRWESDAVPLLADLYRPATPPAGAGTAGG
jgi:RimJ/RimL family protein N-acetyltransferase